MKIIMDVMTSKIEFTEHEEYLKETIHDEMHRNLGVRQEGYFYSPAYKAGYWDGIIDFYNAEDDTFHTGLVNQVESILGSLQGRYPFEFSIVDNRPDPFLSVEDLPNDIKLIGDDGGHITMRDYQYDAVVQVVDKQVGIVEVATNGGKTEIAGAIIQQLLPYLERGERIAFFTNNTSIFTQSIDRIEKRLGIKVGRYGAGHKDIQQVTFVMIPTINASLTADPEKGLKLTGKNAVIKRIAKEIAPKFTKGVNQRLALRNLIKNHPTKSQVDKKVVEELEDILYTCGTDNEIRFRIQGYQAEYQKIVESKNKKVYDKHNEALAFLESVAVMIVDEAHHTSADTWYQSLSKCTNAYYRVALTGSIDRKDHLLWQRLQAIFNKTIIKISNETLINLGHSAKPKITMFPIVSPQGHDESDYMIARDACIVNNEYRNKLISQLTHKYYNEGKGVLILVNIIEHGDNIVELLNDMGIPNAFIHGELPLDYREQQLDNMREGKLKVLIATTIADEGVDISGIDMLILGAGGKSLRQTLQRVGRALRKKKTGENVATIIDFVDYTNKHLLNHSKERRKTYVQEKFEINDIQVN